MLRKRFDSKIETVCIDFRFRRMHLFLFLVICVEVAVAVAVAVVLAMVIEATNVSKLCLIVAFSAQLCSRSTRVCPIPCVRRSSGSCGLGTQEVCLAVGAYFALWSVNMVACRGGCRCCGRGTKTLPLWPRS